MKICSRGCQKGEGKISWLIFVPVNEWLFFLSATPKQLNGLFLIAVLVKFRPTCGHNITCLMQINEITMCPVKVNPAFYLMSIVCKTHTCDSGMSSLTCASNPMQIGTGWILLSSTVSTSVETTAVLVMYCYLGS